MLAVKGIYRDGKIELIESLPSEIKESEVYIVIVPKRESDEDFLDLYQMMKRQEETGFAKRVLGSENEDVWNDI